MLMSILLIHSEDRRSRASFNLFNIDNDSMDELANLQKLEDMCKLLKEQRDRQTSLLKHFVNFIFLLITTLDSFV